MKIIAILNITKDSFFDGNQYIALDKAINRAQYCAQEGASFIDIGAESSHPDSENVSAAEELNKLLPLISELKKLKIAISVDTYKPEVMNKVLESGIDMINDITALSNPESIELLSSYNVPVVLMFSKNRLPRAIKSEWTSKNPIEDIIRFFESKLQKLVQSGLKEENIILDPGMGFFLGANPEPSLSVLKNLKDLKKLGREIYISTSRKSFIGSVCNREIHHRGAATLASEIWAYLEGADYIRTHDVKALNDAIKMIDAIKK